MVHISYVDVAPEKMLLSIEDVLASNDESRVLESIKVNAQKKGMSIK